MQVELNDWELRIAQFIARQRTEYNARNGIKNKIVDAKNSTDHEILGATAEMAFSKLSNTYPDFADHPSSDKSDNRVEGYRIDVKATKLPYGQLLAASYKQVGEVDIYVLAVVDGKTVTFPGYAYSEELISPERITNLGYGDVYAMKQGVLHGFEVGNKTLFQLP